MRRSRIKVVANVPKRRKTDNVETTAADEDAAKVNHPEKVDDDVKTSTEVKDSSSEVKDQNDTNEPENVAVATDSETKTEQRRFRIKAAAKIPVRRKVNVSTTNAAEVKSTEDIVEPEPAKTPVPFLSPPCETTTSNLPSSPLINSSYPRPSPSSSPHKPLNRSSRLFRSAPRIGFRRTSTSASESEDETRRSTCSNISYVSKLGLDTASNASGGAGAGAAVATSAGPTILNISTIPNNSLTQPPENANRLILNQKKKVRRSEFARKIAEAKRDFQHKFGNKIPDRQKLTMMDLIFYNPTNNPMPLREIKKPGETSSVASIHDDDIADIVATAEEEAADEPEEEAMPVPQVKIGENGEIILDEQSLVIETSDMKKINKAADFNAPVINYDELDTGYGVYKRARRTKDWSEAETKQFYRVLQMFGTDFSLMLSYFKNRTRRDLKLKFKKEERINRQLIDKVLLNPRTFDISDLEKLLAEDEQVEKKKMEEKNRNKEAKKLDAEKRKKEKRSKATSWFARQVYTVDRNEIIKDDNPPVEPSSTETPAVEEDVQVNRQKSKAMLKKRIRMRIDSENEEDIENTNALMQQQLDNMFKNPTKSGRVVKSRLPSLTGCYENKNSNEILMEISHDKDTNVESSNVLQLQIISTSDAISKVVATRLRSPDGIIDDSMTATDLYNAIGDDLGITIDESLSQQPDQTIPQQEPSNDETKHIDNNVVENEKILNYSIEYLEEVLSTPSAEMLINKEAQVETQNEGIPIDVTDAQFPLLQSYLGNSDSITLDVAVTQHDNVLP